MHVKAASCDNIDAFGGVAELADAGDLKSLDFGCVGSSPTAPTRYFIRLSCLYDAENRREFVFRQNRGLLG